MNWLQRVLAGRYGVDQLSIAILVLSVILLILSSILQNPILSILTLVPLILCYLRMFSKNIAKRRAENDAFLKVLHPVCAWFRRQKNKFRDRKTHRYFKCPNCKQSLRVPKGRGKISITCPKCKTEFIKAT